MQVTGVLAVLLAVWSADSITGTAWAGRLPQASPSDGTPVFRGVRPPRPGTRNRIRFQTVPERERTPRVPRRRLPDHAWFWEEVPPSLDERGGHDLASALEVVLRRRAAQGPLVTVEEARSILDAYGEEISAAAERHGVSQALLVAVISVESAGRRLAQSPKGAQGLMQLMPATGRRFGVSDPFDAGANILGGTAYLDWLLKNFEEDAVIALAGYNAGEGAVARHGGVPPYAETRDYVVRVLDAFASARELCRDVPESPRGECDWSDGVAPDRGAAPGE